VDFLVLSLYIKLRLYIVVIHNNLASKQNFPHGKKHNNSIDCQYPYFIKGIICVKGTILNFSIQENTGFISGDDNNRYTFAGNEWKSEKAPNAGDYVDFDTLEPGIAKEIFLLKKQEAGNVFTTSLNKISDENKEEKNYNVTDWFIKSLRNYINFSGRARRREYWFFSLCAILIYIFAMILDYLLFGDYALFTLISTLGLIIPSFAVSVRRLHDIGLSGWFILLSIIPLLGAIFLFVCACIDTNKQSNQWGAPAK